MTPSELDIILNSIRDAVHTEVAPLHESLVTLENRLGNVENGLSSLDKRVTSMNERLVKVENQADDLKQYLARRLDEIYDAIQDVMGDMGEYTDKKVTNLSGELEPRISKLEQLHPSGQHSSV